MDPQELLDEAIILAEEVGLALMKEETRCMEESFRADLAALGEKERERSMLMREKDQMFAMKEAEEKLLARFLEADGNQSFDDLKAMMDDFASLRSHEGGDGDNAGGFFGFSGGNLENLENSQNLEDEGVLVATVEGANSGEE